MSYRFMRMMIFFDLPTDTIKDRREYARFRKYLIKNGFVMMQESVYCKLILNQSAVRPATDGIRKNRPPKGLVQMLCVTEKQYAGMEYIVGVGESDVLTTDERFVEL